MSMAAGEYVSVSSQVDSAGADMARERQELTNDRTNELAELAHKAQDLLADVKRTA